jgi:hypothetical protein
MSINLVSNKVEEIKRLIRAKWSKIKSLGLGKTDQILGNNKSSEHQFIPFVFCEFKNFDSLHIRILSFNVEFSNLTEDSRKHLEKILKDRNIRIHM